MICTSHCSEKTLAVEFELLIYVTLSNQITFFLILITVRYVMHILNRFRLREVWKVALVYKTRRWKRINYNKVEASLHVQSVLCDTAFKHIGGTSFSRNLYLFPFKKLYFLYSFVFHTSIQRNMITYNSHSPLWWSEWEWRPIGSHVWILGSQLL